MEELKLRSERQNGNPGSDFSLGFLTKICLYLPADRANRFFLDCCDVSSGASRGARATCCSLAQLLRDADFVMGCSGRRSIRTANLDDLKDGEES